MVSERTNAQGTNHQICVQALEKRAGRAEESSVPELISTTPGEGVDLMGSRVLFWVGVQGLTALCLDRAMFHFLGIVWRV